LGDRRAEQGRKRPAGLQAQPGRKGIDDSGQGRRCQGRPRHIQWADGCCSRADGDIFVSDGHVANANGRIVKFSKDGKFIKAWGKKGSGPGEMDVPHSIAMDSRGRLFVADRANSRIQIFDQDGKFIDQWKQFGRPSGVYIDKNDTIYVADSQSNATQNRGFKRGIYIGSAKDGKVTAMIPFVEPDPDKNNNAGMEGVTADAAGNVYVGETTTMTLKKYVKGKS